MGAPISSKVKRGFRKIDTEKVFRGTAIVEPAAIAAAARRFWNFKSNLLWAFAFATGAAAIVLEIGYRLDPVAWVSARNTAGPWLVIACVACIVFASFKTYQERKARPARIIPDSIPGFWHLAKQQDGRVFTQVCLDFGVYNHSDSALELVDIRLVRPRTTAEVGSRHVAVRHPSNNHYFGRYPILPKSKSDGGASFFVHEDLSGRVKHNTFVLRLVDHLGNKYDIKTSDLRKT